MKKRNYLVNAIILLFVSSCCRTENVTCTQGTLLIRTAGAYATTSPLLIRYRADNTFNNVVDTFTGNFITVAGTDTSWLTFKTIDTAKPNSYVLSDSFGEGLVLGYDYKILFPADTLTYAINDLSANGIAHMEMKHCGDQAPARCLNNPQNLQVNGAATTPLNIAPGSSYMNIVYITLTR